MGNSPGTWSDARQGTSGSAWESVYGNPETVMSEAQSVSTPVPSLWCLCAQVEVDPVRLLRLKNTSWFAFLHGR
jgi:hypothetical protein